MAVCTPVEVTTTVPNSYSLPNILNFTSRISGFTVFSTLDLHKGYYQVSMYKDDILKIATISLLVCLSSSAFPLKSETLGTPSSASPSASIHHQQRFTFLHPWLQFCFLQFYLQMFSSQLRILSSLPCLPYSCPVISSRHTFQSFSPSITNSLRRFYSPLQCILKICLFSSP